jgi:hypothetical protein
VKVEASIFTGSFHQFHNFMAGVLVDPLLRHWFFVSSFQNSQRLIIGHYRLIQGGIWFTGDYQGHENQQ